MAIYMLKPGHQRTFLLGDARRAGQPVVVENLESLSDYDRQALKAHFDRTSPDSPKPDPKAPKTLKNGLTMEQAERKLSALGLTVPDGISIEDLDKFYDSAFSSFPGGQQPGEGAGKGTPPAGQQQPLPLDVPPAGKDAPPPAKDAPPAGGQQPGEGAGKGTPPAGQQQPLPLDVPPAGKDAPPPAKDAPPAGGQQPGEGAGKGTPPAGQQQPLPLDVPPAGKDAPPPAKDAPPAGGQQPGEGAGKQPKK